MLYIKISDPPGTGGPDIDNNVVSTTIIINSPKLKEIPFNCVINIVATIINSAVPSVFIVAPIGRIKRVIRESTPKVFSITRNVSGNVAGLKFRTLGNIFNNSLYFRFITYVELVANTVRTGCNSGQ